MRAWDARRALAIAGKEVRHVRRDPFTLGMALGLPILLLFFFGYAIDLDIRGLRLTVHDADLTEASRAFTEAFSASGFFRVTPGTGPALRELDAERTKAVLIIERGFSADLKAGRRPKAQILLDGADSSSAGTIAGYLAGVSAIAQERLAGDGAGAPPPEPLRTRFLFNPELNSRWFVVPGLVAVIMGLLATVMTALTVAREWENGSMELLLSTPVRPLEIIAGKLLPYLGLGVAGVVMVYATARLAFGVPFQGNHLVFALACLLFLVPCLAQGLLISTATRQQQAAFQIAMISSMLPSLLLSGFMFPVESMPLFFRCVTVVLPARWFMVAVRALFLKGTDLAALALPLGVLALMNLALVGATLKAFKTDLEP